MNKTLIFVGAGGVALGGAVGFVVGRFLLKKKLVHQADARVQEAVDLYNQYLEEAYQGMEYTEEDDEINPVVVKEEEPEKKEAEETEEKIVMPKKPGRITCKPLSEWDESFLNDDGWGHDELIYFPDDESSLTDERGNLLEPLGKYIGNNIDRFIRKDNWDPEDYDENHNKNKFYIWNEPLEMHYLVYKEDNITRDEFFNYKSFSRQ